MKSTRRLIGYVVLNIFVSALVTGSILFFYDRSRPTDCGPAIPTAATGQPSAVNVTIVGVAGAGHLADERITFRNDGTNSLLLTGWTLQDGQGVTYTFPQLTLYPGSSVQVHTASGTNTATDLYWQHSSPVWASGELVVLYDTQNVARAFYLIP